MSRLDWFSHSISPRTLSIAPSEAPVAQGEIVVLDVETSRLLDEQLNQAAKGCPAGMSDLFSEAKQIILWFFYEAGTTREAQRIAAL